MTRRKELDDYNQRKDQLEKELEEQKIILERREARVSEDETILNDLTLKVEGFSDVVKQAVAETEKNLRNQLEKRASICLGTTIERKHALSKIE